MMGGGGGERYAYYVNTIYFVYAIHSMNIVIYDTIKFQSLITDDLLVNLLL